MSVELPYTSTHMLMRWRAEEPPDSPRASRGACDWTRVHVTTTNGMWTLCGLEVPLWPYLNNINDEVPADAPRCKHCQRLATLYQTHDAQEVARETKNKNKVGA